MSETGTHMTQKPHLEGVFVAMVDVVPKLRSRSEVRPSKPRLSAKPPGPKPKPRLEAKPPGPKPKPLKSKAKPEAQSRKPRRDGAFESFGRKVNKIFVLYSIFHYYYYLLCAIVIE